MTNHNPAEDRSARATAIIRMFRDGATYTEIAAEFAVTRNVVAGVIHRAGATRSKSTQTAAKARRPRASRAKRAAAPVVAPEPAAPVVVPIVAVVVEKLEPAPIAVGPIRPVEAPELGRCKFPLWGRDALTGFYCGEAAATPDAVYCERHAARCYAPPPARRKPQRNEYRLGRAPL